MAFLSDLLLGASCGLAVIENDIASIPDSISEGYYCISNYKAEKKVTKDEIIDKIIKKLTKISARLIVAQDITGRVTKQSAKLIAEGYLLVFKEDLKEMKKKDLKKILEKLDEVNIKDLSDEELKKFSGEDMDLDKILKAIESVDTSSDEEDTEEQQEEDQDSTEEEVEERFEDTLKDTRAFAGGSTSKKSSNKTTSNSKKYTSAKSGTGRGRKPSTTKK